MNAWKMSNSLISSSLFAVARAKFALIKLRLDQFLPERCWLVKVAGADDIKVMKGDWWLNVIHSDLKPCLVIHRVPLARLDIIPAVLEGDDIVSNVSVANHGK